MFVLPLQYTKAIPDPVPKQDANDDACPAKNRRDDCDDLPFPTKAHLKAQRPIDLPNRAEADLHFLDAEENRGEKPHAESILESPHEQRARRRSREHLDKHDLPENAAPDVEDVQAFVAEQISISKSIKGQLRIQLAGKTLHYDHRTESDKNRLDVSRRANGRSG